MSDLSPGPLSAASDTRSVKILLSMGNKILSDFIPEAADKGPGDRSDMPIDTNLDTPA